MANGEHNKSRLEALLCNAQFKQYKSKTDTGADVCNHAAYTIFGRDLSMWLQNKPKNIINKFKQKATQVRLSHSGQQGVWIYRQCASLCRWGSFVVTHKGRRMISQRHKQEPSSCILVQAVAARNLRCSFSYGAPSSPSAQPAQAEDCWAASPSLTTWNMTETTAQLWYLDIVYGATKSHQKCRRGWGRMLKHYLRFEELWAWHSCLGLLYKQERSEKWGRNESQICSDALNRKSQLTK